MVEGGKEEIVNSRYKIPTKDNICNFFCFWNQQTVYGIEVWGSSIS